MLLNHLPPIRPHHHRLEIRHRIPKPDPPRQLPIRIPTEAQNPAIRQIIHLALQRHVRDVEPIAPSLHALRADDGVFVGGVGDRDDQGRERKVEILRGGCGTVPVGDVERGEFFEGGGCVVAGR